uniref:Uncharacterized protein n=1 Tax=viral metagenome TaxID=1070528 RepID=A0A6M3LM43_9ZZZZ
MPRDFKKGRAILLDIPEMKNAYKEVCANCGCTLNSHLAQTIYDYMDAAKPVKYLKDYCPGHEGKMDWDKGPGTVFKPSGTYKE